MPTQHLGERTDLQFPAERADLFVPRRWTLDGFAEEVSLVGGVKIRELESITTLHVRTQNTLYRIIVLQPADSRILVQGGQFFADMTPGHLNGSSLGGSFLKMAWIGCGLCMEICCDRGRIVTSPVRSITISDHHSAAPS